MLESFVVIVLPALFLAVLYGGKLVFRHKRIDMDGKPPIGKGLFVASKYAILIPWAGMIIQSLGLNISLVTTPRLLKWISLGLWAVGFGLLFVGRFGLGRSFRIGCPKESTALKADGLFRFSRNPMYLGVYGTVLAATIYALNPLAFLAAGFVVAVHHRIVLGEEVCLRGMFGQPYSDYCLRVRRYL
jgi:protein-S-isoprenylcysteine O-methyltransferase Ste14